MRGCEFCGVAFKPRKPTQRFCSIRCSNTKRNLAHAERQRQRPVTDLKLIERNGYLMEWDRERAKYVYQHRLVMERHLGRRLESNEVVHHLNHDKHDNRLENLQIMDRSSHMRHHGRESKGKPKPWLRTPLEPCPECGQMFKPWSRRGRRTVTCSVSCSNRYRVRTTA